MNWDAFFKIHDDLPREGPGSGDDVAWACAQGGIGAGGVICDAGCGPGGDIGALLQAVPEGRVVAIDTHTPFVHSVKSRFGDDPRVSAYVADMATLADLEEAPFDMIWCAGALYFMGTTPGLKSFAAALKPGAVVAFSAPCHFTDTPSDDAIGFWDGHPTPTRAALFDQVEEAGFDRLASRPVTTDGWEAYYHPLEARIAKLREGGADQTLTQALDVEAAEIRAWRQVREQTGYELVVARLR